MSERKTYRHLLTHWGEQATFQGVSPDVVAAFLAETEQVEDVAELKAKVRAQVLDLARQQGWADTPLFRAAFDELDLGDVPVVEDWVPVDVQVTGVVRLIVPKFVGDEDEVLAQAASRSVAAAHGYARVSRVQVSSAAVVARPAPVEVATPQV